MDGCRQMPSMYAQKQQEEVADLRRGPWSVDEDLLLVKHINAHGERRWNSLAQAAGLKRTGKSCRLRWLNYLRPDIQRGNMTPEEQLLIPELHSRWGNRWSKIAQYLPGRTDNEIKNYWRTRVQKLAKQMKCDVNSQQFRDAMHDRCLSRLVDRIQAARLAADLGQHPEASNFSTSISHNHSSYHQTSRSSSPVSSSIHKAGQFPMGMECQTNRHSVQESSCLITTPSDSASEISETENCYCLTKLTPGTSQLTTPVDFPEYNSRPTLMDS